MGIGGMKIGCRICLMSHKNAVRATFWGVYVAMAAVLFFILFFYPKLKTNITCRKGSIPKTNFFRMSSKQTTYLSMMSPTLASWASSCRSCRFELEFTDVKGKFPLSSAILVGTLHAHSKLAVPKPLLNLRVLRVFLLLGFVEIMKWPIMATPFSSRYRGMANDGGSTQHLVINDYYPDCLNCNPQIKKTANKLKVWFFQPGPYRIIGLVKGNILRKPP